MRYGRTPTSEQFCFFSIPIHPLSIFFPFLQFLSSFLPRTLHASRACQILLHLSILSFWISFVLMNFILFTWDFSLASAFSFSPLNSYIFRCRYTQGSTHSNHALILISHWFKIPLLLIIQFRIITWVYLDKQLVSPRPFESGSER